jgi:hypothetical protein
MSRESQHLSKHATGFLVLNIWNITTIMKAKSVVLHIKLGRKVEFARLLSISSAEYIRGSSGSFLIWWVNTEVI